MPVSWLVSLIWVGWLIGLVCEVGVDWLWLGWVVVVNLGLVVNGVWGLIVGVGVVSFLVVAEVGLAYRNLAVYVVVPIHRAHR